MKKPISYSDLHKLPEDDRIDVIGHAATVCGKIVGVLVDDDTKADRYIQKLAAKFPAARLLSKAPCNGVVLIRFGPPDPAKN